MNKIKLIGTLLLSLLFLSVLATPDNVTAGTYNFTVNNSDPSRGKVVGPGIDCGSTCTTTYDSADAITLTAVPNPGLVVFYWGNGDCDGYPLNGSAVNTSNTCVVKNPYSTTPWGATIAFRYASVTVNARKTGTGEGTVTGVAGINCGNVCSGSVTSGDGVSFTATPAPGSVFNGWYDKYGLIPSRLAYLLSCEVQLDFYNSPNLTMTARFDKATTGPGTGSVTPKPSAGSPPASSSPPPPSNTSAPVSPPAVSAVKVNDSVRTAGKGFTLNQGQAVALEGTTVPNGIVKLFIFSQPREATITADAQGRWKYTIQSLEAGSHHVEAEVTDPVTHQTSGRTTLTSFKIVAASPGAATPRNTGSSAWIWLLVAVCLAGLAGASIWILRQRMIGLYGRLRAWVYRRLRK